MGLLNFLGGSAPEKAKKLKAKVTQKYGDPTTRQKAIEKLGELKGPDAVSALMARFTITVEPLTRDQEEKEQVFNLVTGMGQDAVAPVKEFLFASEHASSWALRVLQKLLPETEVVGLCTTLLSRLGSEYTRDPERKVVLLQYLDGKDDPRIAPATLPFLEDMSDDVKLAALKNLGPRKDPASREPILRLLIGDETGRRVQTAALQALHEGELGVQGFREKVDARIQDPYFLDKAGLVKKR